MFAIMDSVCYDKYAAFRTLRVMVILYTSSYLSDGVLSPSSHPPLCNIYPCALWNHSSLSPPKWQFVSINPICHDSCDCTKNSSATNTTHTSGRTLHHTLILEQAHWWNTQIWSWWHLFFFFFFLAQLWMAPSSHVLTTSPYHNIDPSVDVRRHLSSSVPARLPQRSLHTCDTRLFFCVFACYYKSFKETERHIIMALRCDSYLNIYENEKQILQNHSIPNTLMPRWFVSSTSRFPRTCCV